MSKIKDSSTSPSGDTSPVVDVVAPVETGVTRAIQRWVSKRIHGSPISRNTETYNYLMEQLPELASMIDEENKA